MTKLSELAFLYKEEHNLILLLTSYQINADGNSPYAVSNDIWQPASRAPKGIKSFCSPLYFSCSHVGEGEGRGGDGDGTKAYKLKYRRFLIKPRFPPKPIERLPQLRWLERDFRNTLMCHQQACPSLDYGNNYCGFVK